MTGSMVYYLTLGRGERRPQEVHRTRAEPLAHHRLKLFDFPIRTRAYYRLRHPDDELRACATPWSTDGPSPWRRYRQVPRSTIGLDRNVN
jgi:hypothetical protein